MTRKLWALAWKDLRRQYRSGLLLLMALGVPLLLTTLLYFAFGSTPGGPTLRPTAVALVDLDAPPALSPVAVGRIVREALTSPELSALLTVEPHPGDERATGGAGTAGAGPAEGALERALERVRRGELGAAVVVPTGATTALLAGEPVVLQVVTDPGRPLGGGVVRDVVRGVADALSAGALAGRVTAELAAAQGAPLPGVLAARAAARAAAAPPATTASAVDVAAASAGGGSFVQRMVAEVMAAMMIFFVFFSGAYGASAVLREQEEGTLARLAATPTSAATQLGGRFLGIAAILVVQIAALVIASALLFGIDWGRPLPVVLAGAALAVEAAGFGVVLLAFVRTSRQSGPVFGVVLTVTGMVGGLMTATMPSVPAGFRTAALFTPQGWAMELWRACMAGGGVRSLLPSLGGTLAIGAGLLALGVPLMRRRFAAGG